MNCRSPRLWSALAPALLTTLLAASPLTLAASQAATLPGSPAVAEVKGAIPPMVGLSTQTGFLDASTSVTFAFILPFRNQAGLLKAIDGMYSPESAAYGKYLSHDQFIAQYAPSQADFDAVKAYAVAQGFTIVKAPDSRKMLTLKAPSGLIESAFGIRFANFASPTGHVFYAPLSAPKLPVEIAARITGISGLSTAAVFTNHLHKKPAPVSVDNLLSPAWLHGDTNQPTNSRLAVAEASPLTIGSDPLNGGLTPTDIYTAYNFKPYTSTTPATATGFGGGQTLGLFELDVETPSDIVLYEEKFGLPMLVTTPEIDPTNPVTPTGGEDEVDLDIELQLAMAPLCKAIEVYEGGNVDSLVVQQYQTIADNDTATEVSTSWGSPEVGMDNGSLNGELDAFEQMAAQGQSIFAAAGDNGAMDGAGTSSTVNMTDATALLVDDPSSDPFMTATGGTTLSVVTPKTNLTYLSEASWGTPDTGDGGGGGGGISRHWTIARNGTDQPGAAYQVGVVPNPAAIPSGYPTADTDANYPTNPDPTLYRNTPDLSINANPDTGYSIEFDGAAGEAEIVGGTSAAAPLWSAITARINEQRSLNGLPNIGFLNPTLYRIGTDGYSQVTYQYPTTMHDVQDGSNNLYFPAVKGFDDSTGWGTPNGTQVITEYGSPTPTHLYVNPGYKDNYVFFDIMPKATSYIIKQSLSSTMSKPTTFTATVVPYIIKSLIDKTSYYYTVQAVYSGGTSNPDGSYRSIPQVVAFKTTPNATVTTSGSSITVKWTTTAESNSTVKLGTSATALTQVETKSGYALNHTLTFNNEKEGTLYYYQVISNDGTNTATSPVYKVTLPNS